MKKPWKTPIDDADAPASARRRAARACPACSEIAASALTSASTEPTERSMPPVVMTKVIATATIISGAIWRKMLSRLVSVRKVSVISEKAGPPRRRRRRRCWRRRHCRGSNQHRRERDAPVAVDRGHDCAPLRPRAGRDGLELAADDEVDDLLDIGLADQPLGDVAALVHDHDAVADHEQVLQPVGDQDDADAAGADLADEIEHGVDLGDRQRRRRLVHDEDQRIERGGAADRDALALAAGEVFDLEPRARRCGCRAARACRPRPRASCALSRSGTPRMRRSRLAAEQEIAGDVDRVAEREVLVDHLDPLGAAHRRARRRRPRCPSITMRPESGTTAPDRTLLSVDLPAPLSPTSPSTSPARRVEVDVDRAT